MTKQISWIGWIPISSFGLIIISMYLNWIVASVQLGRRAVPSMDDPKAIGGFATSVYNATSWMIMLLVGVWILGLLISIVVALLPKVEERRNWIIKSALGAVAFPLLF